MRGLSHKAMGKYLAGAYLEEISPWQRFAFQLGCIQPDRNPLTYLKGSLRAQWLRGHNYDNAQKLMGRFSRRLEGRKRLHLLDFYTAGKLLHYTADGFTYPHNRLFSGDLRLHRAYEAALQREFLGFLSRAERPEDPRFGAITPLIRTQHREYCRQAGSIQTDISFIFQVSCGITQLLAQKAAAV